MMLLLLRLGVDLFVFSLGRRITPLRQDSGTAAPRRGCTVSLFLVGGGLGCCLSAPQLSECVPIGGMSLAV